MLNVNLRVASESRTAGLSIDAMISICFVIVYRIDFPSSVQFSWMFSLCDVRRF